MTKDRYEYLVCVATLDGTYLTNTQEPLNFNEWLNNMGADGWHVVSNNIVGSLETGLFREVVLERVRSDKA